MTAHITDLIIRDCCECDRPERYDVDTVELRVSDLRLIIDRHLASLLPGCTYMDPPDGGDVPVSEQIERMAADAAAYRALAPQQPSEPPPADLYGQMKAWEQSGELIPRAWATMRDQELLIKKLEAQIAAQQPSQGAEEGGWGIDVSAGREILVYGRCSVIEEEQARYALNLIAADMARPAPEASGAMPLSEEEIAAAVRPFYRDAIAARMALSMEVATARAIEHAVWVKNGISATSKEDTHGNR